MSGACSLCSHRNVDVESESPSTHEIRSEFTETVETLGATHKRTSRDKLATSEAFSSPFTLRYRMEVYGCA
jgi:anti-sigma regulatory factor (Ser/Thr protein kinase)